MVYDGTIPYGTICIPSGVAAREAVLVAETADAATVTVLADISGL
jgi:hypothetical protein